MRVFIVLNIAFRVTICFIYELLISPQPAFLECIVIFLYSDWTTLSKWPRWLQSYIYLPDFSDLFHHTFDIRERNKNTFPRNTTQLPVRAVCRRNEDRWPLTQIRAITNSVKPQPSAAISWKAVWTSCSQSCKIIHRYSAQASLRLFYFDDAG